MEEQIKEKGRTPAAAKAAIDISLQRGILVEYLMDRRAEVEAIMQSVFSREYAQKLEVQAAEARGEMSGYIEMCFDVGMSVEEIVQLLVDRKSLSTETATVNVAKWMAEHPEAMARQLSCSS